LSRLSTKGGGSGRPGRPARGTPEAAAARGAALPAPEPRAAMWLVALVATACVLVSVSFRLYDADAWQHLAFGRALWTSHAIPVRQIFVWPDLGIPLVNPSWGFSALLWPFWSLGGIPGLFVWRWLTTLAVFLLLWDTARRLGARGFTPLFVLVVCALIYRQRSQIRPETLASVWFALTVWLLEGRRQALRAGPPRLQGVPAADRTPWLIAVAFVWANSHISYYLGFLVLGIHLIEAEIASRTSPGGLRDRSPRRLWWIGLAMAAVSFLNPYGWHALARPFEFVLSLRHEPLMRSISELKPVDWSLQRANGLPLVMVLWPLLAVGRAWRRGPDRVELLTCAVFTVLGFSSARFVAGYALAAAPYLARDLSQALGAVPRLALPAWPRAAIAAAACVAAGWTEWSHFQAPIGVGFDLRHTPAYACDFMAAHQVRGHGFNHFYLGGTMIFRFWPDTGRLPFVDIHPEDWPRERREAYYRAISSAEGWAALDQRYRFDYALLSRRYLTGYGLPDLLDSDRRWALVFVDDIAALYVRRDGSLAAVADTFAYRQLSGGAVRMPSLLRAAVGDRALRAGLIAELERQAAASPMNVRGRQMLRALGAAEAPSGAR
jgi:hypothetical protein